MRELTILEIHAAHGGNPEQGVFNFLVGVSAGYIFKDQIKKVKDSIIRQIFRHLQNNEKQYSSLIEDSLPTETTSPLEAHPTNS